MITDPRGGRLTDKLGGSELGVPDFGVVGVARVRIVDQQPPVVAGGFGPENVVVWYTSGRTISSFDECK